MTTETVYLEFADVRVTSTKVIIGGTTYFLANITSLKIREDSNLRAVSYVIGCLALIATIAGISNASAGAAIVGALVLVVAGFMWWDGVSYDLILTTGASEQQALHSKDRALLTRVLAAINVAVEQRQLRP